MLTEITQYLKAHPEAFPRHRGSDLPLGQGIRKENGKCGSVFVTYYRGEHYGDFDYIKDALETWNEADHRYWDTLNDDQIHWVSYHGERTHQGQAEGLFDEDGYKIKPLPRVGQERPRGSMVVTPVKLCPCGQPAAYANDSRCEECWAAANSQLLLGRE